MKDSTEVGSAVAPIDISVWIQARPATVWHVLVDPDRFMAWMGSAGGEFSGAPGTSYELPFPQFGTRIAGEVEDLVENERLCLTWGVAEGPQAETVPAGSTRVVITLEPEDGGTRVSLRHSGLPTDDERASHEAGWRFHLGRLALLANRAFLGPLLESVAAGFLRAWNEPAGDRRAELLARICESDLEFADEYATLTGTERLSRHIGNSQSFMPGSRVEQDGEPLVCLGEALLPFRIVDAEGIETHRGVHHLVFSTDGRLERVRGFWR